MEQQTVQMEQTTVNVIIYVFGFIFTSLVGIIVFLARNLLAKVDSIKINQEESIIEYTEMKKDVSGLLKDFQVVKRELGSVQSIKEDVIRNTKDIESMKDLLREYRINGVENSKSIRDIEKTLNKQ